MTDDHEGWRCRTIVEAERSRRLQASGGDGARVLACHARMEARHERQHHGEHDDGVTGAEEDSVPDPGAQALEESDVEERKKLPIQEMGEEPDQLRFLARGREDGTEEVRDAHAGEPGLLASGLDGSEDHGRDEAREKTARERHRDPPAASTGSACEGRFPLRRSSRVSAAFTSPRCVKPCGKFPSGSPVAGSISSAYRPTSFAYPSAPSNIAEASSRLPPPSARYSAAQNVQMPKAP